MNKILHAARVTLFSSLIALCPGFVKTAQASSQTVPAGAFLIHPAATDTTLRRQVNSSAEVRKRYARLWHTDHHGVIDRVNSWHLTRLSSDCVMRVYYYRPNQTAWGYKVRKVTKGTSVFASKDGTPRLLQVCGNPVERVTPARLTKAPAVKSFTPAESPEGMRVVDVQTELPDIALASLTSPEITAPAESAVLPPVITAAPPILATSGSSSLPIPLPAGGGGSHFPIAALVPVLGAGFAFGGHGGGGGVTITPPTGTEAPEPGAICFVAPALIGMIGLQLRRRRRA